MSKTHTPVKRIIFFSLLVGLVLGTMVAYILFPRVITKKEGVVSEKIVHDTVFVVKPKIVYKTKYIKPVHEDSLLEDSIKLAQGNLDSANIDLKDSNNLATTNTPQDSVGSEELSASNSTGVIEDDGHDINIAQNELLETQYIIPEGNPSNFYCQPNSDYDSLLVDNYTAKAKQEGIKVEFWRSPINTVGYQLGKSILILYGFYQFREVGLKYMEDGSIQMTYLQNTYKLECGNEFRTLIIKQ